MKQFAKNDPNYAYLMKQAHALHPVVTISTQGLQDAHHAEIEQQFLAHELLKIKIITPDKSLKQQYLAEISEKHEATLVNMIGHVSIWFKKKQKV